MLMQKEEKTVIWSEADTDKADQPCSCFVTNLQLAPLSPSTQLPKFKQYAEVHVSIVQKAD